LKAAPFEYARAASLAEACALLDTHGESAKLVAGGQSLVPMMAMRLVRPAFLVDINEIDALKFAKLERDFARTGACTRQAVIERDDVLAASVPLLRQALAWVGHVQTRNRGTIGGSLAHADPASELPACVIALDAVIVIRGPRGERRIAAEDFFVGIYETALSADELLMAIEVPLPPPQSVHHFREFARRHGDYAIVGLAAQAVVNNQRFTDFRPVFFGVGDKAERVTVPALLNTEVTREALRDALQALEDALDPPEDQQANRAMRIHLAKVLLARCVSALMSRPDLEHWEEA
jgi:carbon-monoxide dehydrogenase medium subunit